MQISLKQLQPEVTQKIDKNEESVGLLKNRIDNMVNTTHGNEIIVEIHQVYDSIEDMLADAQNVDDDFIVSVNDTENYTVLIYKRDSNFTKDEVANNEDGFHFLSKMNSGVYFKAVAATPVVLYNSLNTTIECVETLPSEAKVVPWTKSSEGFWTASKEDVV